MGKKALSIIAHISADTSKPRIITGIKAFAHIVCSPLFLPGGVMIVFSTMVPLRSEETAADAISRLSRAEEAFTRRFAEKCQLELVDNDEPIPVTNGDGSISAELHVYYEPKHPWRVLRAVGDCWRAVEAASIVAA